MQFKHVQRDVSKPFRLHTQRDINVCQRVIMLWLDEFFPEAGGEGSRLMCFTSYEPGLDFCRFEQCQFLFIPHVLILLAGASLEPGLDFCRFDTGQFFTLGAGLELGLDCRFDPGQFLFILQRFILH